MCQSGGWGRQYLYLLDCLFPIFADEPDAVKEAFLRRQRNKKINTIPFIFQFGLAPIYIEDILCDTSFWLLMTFKTYRISTTEWTAVRELPRSVNACSNPASTTLTYGLVPASLSSEGAIRGLSNPETTRNCEYCRSCEKENAKRNRRAHIVYLISSDSDRWNEFSMAFQLFYAAILYLIQSQHAADIAFA